MVSSERDRGLSKQRGLALIGVIGLLLIVLVFAGGMVAQLAVEVNSVKTEGVSNRALSAADAGVHAMVEQIQTNIALNLPAPGPAPIAYTYPEPAGTPAGTSYSATIDTTWQAKGLNYYQITSTGTYDNGVEHIERTVRAIARARPISSFASFSNYEVNRFGKPVWYRPDQKFDGPVYSGGPMRIDYNDTQGPIFLSTVQTGNTPVWNDENDAGPPDPADAADWNSIVSGGFKNFIIDKTPLSLPQPPQNLYVASEAWQGDGSNAFSSGFPAVSPGVYIDGLAAGGKNAADPADPPNDTTGIFVNVDNGGTVGTAVISGSVSGNTQTFTINGPGFGGAYTVVVNYGSSGTCNGTTTVTHAGNSHTFVGTPCGAPGPGVTNSGNGAIFVNGNIQFGTGASPDVTIQGQYSFVTPDYGAWDNKNNITLLGNFKYASDPTPTFDKAALWGNDVILRTLAMGPITIDASIIAGYPGEIWKGGEFRNFYCNASNCGASDQGQLIINGGLIENSRGAVGELVGKNHTGFSRVINFDSRFATSPPPFNPSTGSLSIIAWEDLGT